MLKRKLQCPSVSTRTEKRKREQAAHLDILFQHLYTDEGPATCKPQNVSEALTYLKSLVIWPKFSEKLPPIVLRSQLYALLRDRSKIDTELDALRLQGEICIVKLDSRIYGIISKDDYQNNVEHQLQAQSVSSDLMTQLERFDKIETDIEFAKQELLTYFKEERTVSELVRAGIFTSECTGNFYRTVPNASLFLRHLNNSVKAVTAKIRRAKFKEVLMSEVLTLKLPKTAYIGATYSVLDLIGKETVKLIETTTGPLLRYVEGDELNN